jgi:hypothetical protein
VNLQPNRGFALFPFVPHFPPGSGFASARRLTPLKLALQCQCQRELAEKGLSPQAGALGHRNRESMKLAEFERRLRQRGCAWYREGAAHSIWFNPTLH